MNINHLNNKRRDILFLCQYFYPEYNSSATLPYDTAIFFAKQGYQVGALCGYPKEYFEGEEVPFEETVEGINIRRVSYIQSKRSGKIGRLINYLSFTVNTVLHLHLLKDYRCIICYSNPPILPIVAVLAASLFRCKVLFVAYDVYPEVAYASGSIRPGSAIDRIMNRINHRVYTAADRIIVLSEEMRSFILKSRPGISEDRISVIHNWAHEEREERDRLSDISIDNRKQGMEANASAKIATVSYFGNMGICQDIETILDAAKETKDDTSIQYELIGHGNKRDSIRSFIDEQQLANIRLQNYLTGAQLNGKLTQSTCCIVSLTQGLRGMCAPSKYYTYLYSGKPVISIMDNSSYISSEVRREKIGFSVQNGDTKELIKAIKKLRDNLQETKTMGQNAKRLYNSEYRYDLAMDQYQRVVNEVLQSPDK